MHKAAVLTVALTTTTVVAAFGAVAPHLGSHRLDGIAPGLNIAPHVVSSPSATASTHPGLQHIQATDAPTSAPKASASAKPRATSKSSSTVSHVSRSSSSKKPTSKHHTSPPPADSGGSSAGGTAMFEPANGDVYLGVSSNWGDVASFSSAAGIKSQPAIWNNYTEADGSFSWILNQVKARPAITPMVSWNLPLTGNQVTNGSKDSYIKAQAALVKSFGGPVFVRLDWEMNGNWYPQYSQPAVTPAQFVASWRRVYDIFHDAGVRNAAFVWCPNTYAGGNSGDVQLWYPGNGYVDWMGLDAYPQFSSASFMLTGPAGYNAMAKFAASHNKPLMLAEWAVTSKPHTTLSDAAAINMIFDWAARYPATVKALIYFSYSGQGNDFKLPDHASAAAAFRSRTVGKENFLLRVPGS